MAINNTSVESLDQLRNIIDNLPPSSPFVVQVERGGKREYVAMRLE